MDVAINSINGRLILLRNTGASGHWLEVKVGAFAPGAEVTVTLPGGRKLVRELHAGSSYLSSEDPRAHFGLGAATRVKEVVVRFPDGRTVRRTGVAADQLLVVAPLAGLESRNGERAGRSHRRRSRVPHGAGA